MLEAWSREARSFFFIQDLVGVKPNKPTQVATLREIVLFADELAAWRGRDRTKK